MINQEFAYIANLGDTRAIVSTTSHDSSFGKNSIIAFQLTQEHRPEFSEEYDRIINKGGRVQKIINADGNFIGPYRVWEADRNYPGLTVSRTLGNKLAKDLGVISEPFTVTYRINYQKDFFLVFASDGIWSVLDNQDVVNFIEAYRDSCIRGLDNYPDEEFISFNNTCIAQMLCEEARTRWILKIEDDDIAMDDISCVIIEIKQSDDSAEVIHDDQFGVNIEQKNLEMKRSPTLKDDGKQSRSNSLIGVSVLNSKTEM